MQRVYYHIQGVIEQGELWDPETTAYLDRHYNPVFIDTLEKEHQAVMILRANIHLIPSEDWIVIRHKFYFTSKDLAAIFKLLVSDL